jgi:hypothetical protein
MCKVQTILGYEARRKHSIKMIRKKKHQTREQKTQQDQIQVLTDKISARARAREHDPLDEA